MTERARELLRYDTIRECNVATAFVARVSNEMVVLGSSQVESVVCSDVLAAGGVRRRRGGGGAVLLRPDDLWIDWWIPSTDSRFCGDVGEQALVAGRWWIEGLVAVSKETFELYDGALTGDEELRVACFAGRGRGEVVRGDRKVVGVMQWRVREGALISTLLPSRPMADLVALLAHPTSRLSAAMNHDSLQSLGLGDRRDELQRAVLEAGGPWALDSLTINL